MKGQANIFGVIIGGSIMLLVVGMVLALTYMFIASTSSVTSGLNTTISGGTVIFAGINGTSYALAENPMTLATFRKSVYENQSNTTNVINTNSSFVYLNSLYYNVPMANLTICYNNTNNSSTTVKLNNVTLGNLTTYTVSAGALNCTTYASQESRIAATNNVSFVNNNASIRIWNITMLYSYFNTSTQYTIYGDTIIPRANGTFRYTYTYALTGVDTDSAVAALGDVTDAIDLFPQWLVMVVFGTLMVGLLGLVIGIVVFVRQGGLIGGGLQ